MFDIASVSFDAPTAPAEFAKSLHETGFAVLKNHPISPDRIAGAYTAWGAFFNSEEKFAWTHKDGSVEGYFPFRSENAKDSPVKDLKEFYHVYEQGAVPPQLAAQTRALYADLTKIGATLLSWLQAQSPPEVTAALSEPLPDMLAGSAWNLLRVLHYPALDVPPEPGAVRAAAHGDINLLTCLLSGSAPGLEAKDTAGHWRRVPCDPGMMVINAGDMLDLATRGYYPSTIHRVVNPETPQSGARFSMPMFLHPRPEVMLADGVSADAFLQQRLREIGLTA